MRHFLGYKVSVERNRLRTQNQVSSPHHPISLPPPRTGSVLSMPPRVRDHPLPPKQALWAGRVLSLCSAENSKLMFPPRWPPHGQGLPSAPEPTHHDSQALGPAQVPAWPSLLRNPGSSAFPILHLILQGPW